MQADNSSSPVDPADSGAGEGGIRPLLPEKRTLTTITIVGSGKLFVKDQDAIDEHGFIEFAMASRDGSVFFNYYVRPNDACTADDVIDLAIKAGNELLLDTYAHQARQQKGRKSGE